MDNDDAGEEEDGGKTIRLVMTMNFDKSGLFDR
jgi:hypothetical protein